MESELILSRGGFPPLSARGCVQTLIPIETGILRRTINGGLIYVGKPLLHKYRSTITCEDKAPLALEGLWRGGQVRVGCLQRLWQKADTVEVTLERDPVNESVVALGAEVQKVEGRKVVLDSLKGAETFVSYRPWMEMRVISFTLFTREWELKVGWKLELEEI